MSERHRPNVPNSSAESWPARAAPQHESPHATSNVAVLWTALLACSCIPQITTGDGSQDAGATPFSPSTGNPQQAQGAGCATDSTGGQLCSAVSTCPTLSIDHSVLPNCGFRVNGAILDLECDCGGALCPIGIPTSCAGAAAVLQNQTESVICEQLNEGRCSGPSAAAPGAFTPTPTSGTPAASIGSCDTSCRDECAGVPGCIQLCGC